MIEKNSINVYEAFDIALERGAGTRVFDVNGKEYLDFVSGVGVNCLGKSHPWIVNTLHEQSQKLAHISNLHWSDKQGELSKKLIENTSYDKVFFCNSGAEALDTALKLSQKYGELKGDDKNKIIFGDKYNDIESIQKEINSNTCAVILEPIQEDGEINSIDIDFLKSVRDLCGKYDSLLIYDEVECGIGRTGKLFAYESLGVAPDVLCISKGLGGGFPIGAILTIEKIANAIKLEEHGCILEGSSLASEVALSVLDELIDKSLIDNINEKSKYMMKNLEELKEKHDNIIDIQGMGLLLGIKLSIDPKKVIDKCLEKGLLIFAAGKDAIKILPPLNVEEEDMNFAINILDDVLQYV